MRTTTLTAAMNDPLLDPEAPYTLAQLQEAVMRVLQDHEMLRAKLGELYMQTRDVRRERDKEELKTKLRLLIDAVREFQTRFAVHSQWEETELFPLAVRCFGNEMDAFTTLEHEHRVAERYLVAFLEQCEMAFVMQGAEEAAGMASYLLQAYALLKNHFAEEEELLLACAAPYEAHSH